MKLLGRFAQSGIVLLNEVPANLIFGEIVTRCASSSSLSRTRGSCVLLGCVLILILLREATIGRHVVEGVGMRKTAVNLKGDPKDGNVK